MSKDSTRKVRDMNVAKLLKLDLHISIMQAEKAKLERIVANLDDRILVDDTKGMSWFAMGRTLGCHPDTAKKRVTAARRRVRRGWKVDVR